MLPLRFGNFPGCSYIFIIQVKIYWRPSPPKKILMVLNLQTCLGETGIFTTRILFVLRAQVFLWRFYVSTLPYSPDSSFLGGSRLEFTNWEFVWDLQGRCESAAIISKGGHGERWWEADVEVQAGSREFSLLLSPCPAFLPDSDRDQASPTNCHFTANSPQW